MGTSVKYALFCIILVAIAITANAVRKANMADAAAAASQPTTVVATPTASASAPAASFTPAVILGKSTTLGEMCSAEDAMARFQCAMVSHPEREIREDFVALFKTHKVGVFINGSSEQLANGMTFRVDAAFRILPTSEETPLGLRETPVVQIHPMLLEKNVPIKFFQRRMLHEYQHAKDFLSGRFPRSMYDDSSSVRRMTSRTRDDVLRMMKSEIPAYVTECAFAKRIDFTSYRNNDACSRYVSEGEKGIARWIVQAYASRAEYVGVHDFMTRAAEDGLWKK